MHEYRLAADNYFFFTHVTNGSRDLENILFTLF